MHKVFNDLLSDDVVTPIHIVEGNKSIFDTDMEYIIPLYQRAYAWEDKQLIQLIEDINDIADDMNYYIGTLIVSRQDNLFEVVDGQQRLTSLYLLLNCLGYEVKNTLTFACREKSNYTLQNIQDLLQMNRSKLDMERIEPGIQNGINVILQEINKFSKEQFCDKLSRVVVYRIEVPKNTDLNRYFEIMNTRGEQLEQHDILKATMMGYLTDEKDKAIFAKIWDACSDMTGYVQMHFSSRGNKVREAIFGSYWNDMPPKSWSNYKKNVKVSSLNGAGKNIKEIIQHDFRGNMDEGYLDDDIRVRFESIIDFSYFLMHTLKVYVTIKGISHENAALKLIDELLDDKKLLESFSRVVKHGVSVKGRINDNKEFFSREFIICLLRTRYIFDKFIIKREYANESSDGEWSLKSLYVSGKQSKKKAYYRSTKFTCKGEHNQEIRSNERNKQNIMLQSALRVSYTSPKVMHWITQLLIWLSEDKYTNALGDDLSIFNGVVESIAKKAVRKQFFGDCHEDNDIYEMGVGTPHIVFNYLDYLLWKENPKKYDDFAFEFRNSVEHWYPQNPSEGTFESWKEGVDRFGNLCIIQRNVNSKFSNMSPEAKKSTFKEMISKGSIKLRIMSELTEKGDGKTASLYWKDEKCEEHEKNMIQILREACFRDGE